MRRICVFCGSSSGARPEYAAVATALGTLLAQRGIGLVYGGASVGLMGTMADAALAAGGEVHGVIPRGLFPDEIPHGGLTGQHVVDSMHERKALMAELSDGFVAMPGGSGTLEEIFEVFTWLQLGIHGKGSVLLDVAGYWDPLEALLDRAVEERFLRAEHRAMLPSVETPEDAVATLEAFHAPRYGKWIDRPAP
jgi:uncharacterized protein (TIGR00730 family)